MNALRSWSDYEIETFRKDPDEALTYLRVSWDESASDGDWGAFLLALETVIEALHGVEPFAAKIGLPADHLSKMLSADELPKLTLLDRVFRGLGQRLTVQPIPDEETAAAECSR